MNISIHIETIFMRSVYIYTYTFACTFGVGGCVGVWCCAVLCSVVSCGVGAGPNDRENCKQKEVENHRDR